MNNSTCDAFLPIPVIVFSATNGFTLFVCLFAVALLCTLKLHSKTIYRLSLYQVLPASALAIQSIGQIFLLDRSVSSEAGVHSACKVFAFLFLYIEWVKLLFVVWAAFHVFCFAVFYKNLKRLEILYVTTSLIIPAGIASVPFATNTYGPSQSWCWIEVWKDNCPGGDLLKNGVIEVLGLWYGPAVGTLGIVSVAMICMIIILLYRAFIRRSLTGQNWRMIKQFLPLVSYPILFFLFLLPQLILRFYYSGSMTSEQNKVFSLGLIACSAGWSLSAGVAVIAHVLLCDVCPRRPLYTYAIPQYRTYRAL